MMTPRRWGAWALGAWVLVAVAYFVVGAHVATALGIVAMFPTFGVVASLVNGSKGQS